MIVGFLALRFPSKTSVLYVIDISLCACGCDRGLIFRKNNSRSNSVFNSGVIVRSGESQEILNLYLYFYNMEEVQEPIPEQIYTV
jgi:hypothetical protein